MENIEAIKKRIEELPETPSKEGWARSKQKALDAYEKQQYQEALKLLRRAAADAPDKPASTEDIDFMFTAIDCHVRVAEYDMSEDMYQSIIEDLDKDSDPAWPKNLIRALNGLARVSIITGNFSQADSALKKATDLSATHKLNDSNDIATKVLEGELNWKQLNLDKSEKYYSEALTSADKFGSEGRSLEAASLNGLSSINYLRGKFKIAKAQAEQSLSIRRQLFGEESLEAAESMLTLAQTLESTEATQLRLRALALQVKRLGTMAHPTIGHTLFALSDGMTDAYAKKESLTTLAGQTADGILDSQNPFRAKYLARLAAVYLGQERLKLATETCNRAIELQSKIYGPNSYFVAQSLCTLGLAQFYDALEREKALKGNGNLKLSETTIRKAIQICEDRLGECNFQSGSLYHLLSMIKNEESDHSAAEAAAKKSIEIYEKYLEPNDPRIDSSRKALISYYVALKKEGQAKELIETCLNNQIQRTGLLDKKVSDLFLELAEIEGKETNRFAKKIFMQLPGIETGILPSMDRVSLRSDPDSAAAKHLTSRVNELLRKAEQTYGLDSPRLDSALLRLAKMYETRNNVPAAEDAYRRLLVLQENGFGEHHPILIKTLTMYSDLLKQNGRAKESEALMTRIENIRKAG